MGKARSQAIETAFDATAYAPLSAALTPIHDVATFNSTFNWETASGLPGYIQDKVGTTIRGKVVLPEGLNVPGTVSWQLDTGLAISPQKGLITYSFLDSAHSTGIYNSPHYGFPEGVGYSPFTPAQEAAARIAIHNWDDLIQPSFQEKNGSGSADIVFANTTTGPAQAWTYYPSGVGGKYSQYKHLGSDLWVADPRINGSNAQLDSGFYGLQTLNHELGHALGLSHPGAYNYGADTDGDGKPDPITYTKDAFYFQDSNQYTIMSYFGSEETGAQPVDWNVLRYVYPSTPMVDDVYVIQQKYGADMTTRTGDTTYGFNATSDVWNDAMRFAVGKMGTVFTIWDAGGHDKLDLSGYYTPSVIDLREGAYSSAGGWGAYDPSIRALDPSQIGADAALAIINANNAAAGLSPRIGPALYGSDYFYRLYFEGGIHQLNPDGSPVLDSNGNPVLLNEGLSWSQITNSGATGYLMQQNIGIAYGTVIEDAIGGHGNDRINGNQASNSFTGGEGADTFIIADYSGRIPDPTSPTGYKTVTDTLHDRITDFTRAQNDKIDLTSFAGVTFSDLNYNSTTHDLTIHRHDGAADFHLTLDNVSGVIASDFIFG